MRFNINAISGRLIAEKAKNKSDKELKRCLLPTIGGHLLYEFAKKNKEKLIIDKEKLEKLNN